MLLNVQKCTNIKEGKRPTNTDETSLKWPKEDKGKQIEEKFILQIILMYNCFRNPGSHDEQNLSVIY